jgi:hypothetical protein
MPAHAAGIFISAASGRFATIATFQIMDIAHGYSA